MDVYRVKIARIYMVVVFAVTETPERLLLQYQPNEIQHFILDSRTHRK